MEHQNNALSLEINLHYLPPKSISCIDPFFQVCKRISSQRGSQTLPKSGGNSKMPGPFWSMLLMLCLASTVCKNWVLDCSKEILHRTSDGSGHIPGHGIWIYIDSIFSLRKRDWINDFHPTSQNHLRYFDKIFFSWPSGGLGHRISCDSTVISTIIPTPFINEGPLQKPPFLDGWTVHGTFHEPLKFFEFPRSNALGTPEMGGGLEDELRLAGFPINVLGIGWVVPLPSNSYHQDYYMFSRGSL